MSESESVGRAQQENQAAAGWVTIAIAVVITLLVVWFDVVWWRSAGALWRDEVNSANLAAVVSVEEIAPNLQFDSFPILYFLALRGWTLGGDLTSDHWIRTSGFVVVLVLLLVLWLAARVFGQRVPIVSLALFGAHAVTVRYASSIRGYGFATILIITAFILLWNAAKESSAWWSWPAAFLAILLAAHAAYQNWVFILAMCLACAAVCFTERRPRAGILALAAGLLAGLSVLPYISVLRQAEQWNELAKAGFSFATVLRTLKDSLRLGGPAQSVLWLSLGVAVIALGLRLVLARRSGDDMLAYCGLTLVFATMGFVVFLQALSYTVRPWYFLPWMGLAAVAADPVVMSLMSSKSARALLSILVVVATVMAWTPLSAAVETTHTNVDAIADAIEDGVKPGDLVVVYPWMCGITFDRYFRGHAEWVTMPTVSDHRWHRWDQYKEELDAPQSIAKLRAKVHEVMDRGGRVWLVTLMEFEPRMDNVSGYAREDQRWRVEMREELTRGRRVFGPWRPSVQAAYLEDPWLEVWQLSASGEPVQPPAPSHPGSSLHP